MSKTINSELGKGKPNICDYCKGKMEPHELNYEAKIHHGAIDLRCINRKSCEKRKKRSK